MKDIQKVKIRDVAGGCVIAVKAVPGASRDKIAGVLGDCLKIATSAPPEKGNANAAVAAILAKSLRLDKRGVELSSGPTSPRKEFRIAGLTAQALRERMADMDR
jgi:uncharacterized protein (TIGR00251 family)